MMDRTDPALARERLEWIERVDALLARAETLTGMARAEDAPLAARIGLSVEIIALRQEIAMERRSLTDAGPR